MDLGGHTCLTFPRPLACTALCMVCCLPLRVAIHVGSDQRTQRVVWCQHNMTQNLMQGMGVGCGSGYM